MKRRKKDKKGSYRPPTISETFIFCNDDNYFTLLKGDFVFSFTREVYKGKHVSIALKNEIRVESGLSGIFTVLSDYHQGEWGRF